MSLLEALFASPKGGPNPLQQLVSHYWKVQSMKPILSSYSKDSPEYRIATKLDNTRGLIEELEKLTNKDSEQKVELSSLDFTEANKTFDSLANSDTEEGVFLQALLDFDFESAWNTEEENSRLAEEFVKEFTALEKAYNAPLFHKEEEKSEKKAVDIEKPKNDQVSEVKGASAQAEDTITGRLYIDLGTSEYYCILAGKIYYIEQLEKVFKLLTEELITNVRVLGYDLKPALFKSIIEKISQSKFIDTVDISENRLQEHGPEILTLLANSPNICSINIANNWLGNHGMKLVEALRNSSSFRSIDLRDNNFNKEEKELIKSDLEKNFGYYTSKETFTNQYDILQQYEMSTKDAQLISFAGSAIELYM